MTEKNSPDNQNSKKKYKWFAVILIALLLLLIGSAGYYLEKDLIQFPNDKLEEQEDQAQNGNLKEREDQLRNGKLEERSEQAQKEKLEEKGEQVQKNGQSKSQSKVDEKEKTAENKPKSSKNGNNNQLKTDKKNESKAVGNSPTADNEYREELSDPSILDRILSILGLAENDFSEKLNILFVGLDDEESVSLGTIEADSIMLGKLRPKQNKLEIININEDTIYQDQALRDYYNGDLRNAVEAVTAAEIDYHVYVNYKGFEKVIDELGGVKINLDKKVVVPALGLNLKAGSNLLSGKEALNFVRWKGNNSLDRSARQKLLISSVIDKLKGNNILFNVKDLYHTIVESYNSVKTDIDPILAAEIFSYIKENDEFSLEFNQ